MTARATSPARCVPCNRFLADLAAIRQGRAPGDNVWRALQRERSRQCAAAHRLKQQKESTVRLKPRPFATAGNAEPQRWPSARLPSPKSRTLGRRHSAHLCRSAYSFPALIPSPTAQRSSTCCTTRTHLARACLPHAPSFGGPGRASGERRWLEVC